MKQPLYTFIATTFLITLSLSGCNDSDHNDDYYITGDAKDYYGTWEQVGYGNVWVIDSKGAQRFQHTRQTCTQLPFLSNAELEAFPVGQSLIDKKIKVNKQSFSALPLTDASFRRYFTRMDKLPAKCQADQLITTATPTQQFEIFWHSFNDYYAFFDKRGVDWQQQYTTYQPMINDAMSQEALFSVFSDMLAPIDDGHIALSAGGERGFSPEQPAQLTKDLQYGFQQQSEISTFEEYEARTHFAIRQVQASYLRDLKQAGGPDAAPQKVTSWGKINGDIGFIQVDRMVGISNTLPGPGINFVEEDLAAIKEIMALAVTDFKDVKALVIDVRSNEGGLDNVALAIANHFARERKQVLTKYTNNWQGRTRNVHAYLNPTSQQLHVPIAVLSSDLTASAAEVFLLAMRSIPEVTIIGERSDGVFSISMDKQLLNDMEVSLSNEIWLDHQEQNYEVSGVPVDIAVTAFDLDGFGNGKDTALEAAIDHLKAQIQ